MRSFGNTDVLLAIPLWRNLGVFVAAGASTVHFPRNKEATRSGWDIAAVMVQVLPVTYHRPSGDD